MKKLDIFVNQCPCPAGGPTMIPDNRVLFSAYWKDGGYGNWSNSSARWKDSNGWSNSTARWKDQGYAWSNSTARWKDSGGWSNSTSSWKDSYGGWSNSGGK